MIIGFFGNMGQGKTLSAVRELKKFYDKGFKIYSNTFLNFPFTPLTLDMILDIIEKDLDVPDNSVMFIDEIWVWADSRLSPSKRNRVVSYFLMQTRKLNAGNNDYGLVLLFTAQFPDQCDKRLRHGMDIAVECEKLKSSQSNDKYFVQTEYIFRGKKSYMRKRWFKGTKGLYALYDTRKKIRAILKDRYSKDEIEVSSEEGA